MRDVNMQGSICTSIRKNSNNWLASRMPLSRIEGNWSIESVFYHSLAGIREQHDIFPAGGRIGCGQTAEQPGAGLIPQPCIAGQRNETFEHVLAPALGDRQDIQADFCKIGGVGNDVGQFVPPQPEKGQPAGNFFQPDIGILQSVG